MKLISHNFLASSHLKGVKKGFPLIIKSKNVKEVKVEYNRVYLTTFIPRIEWDVLYQIAESLGKSENLPKKVVAEFEKDEDFLKKAHHILREVEVVSGDLVCPETGRKFPINNGIVNMLLTEDEV